MRKEIKQNAATPLALIYPRLLSFVHIYFHLLSFGVGDDRHGVRSNTSEILSKRQCTRRTTKRGPSLLSHLLSFDSFGLTCSHLLSFAIVWGWGRSALGVRANTIEIFSKIQCARKTQTRPLSRSHLLSFDLVCSRLLSFTFICSRLGLGTICMRRSFKYERNIFKTPMRKENNKARPPPYALIYSRLLYFALTCSRLLSFALVWGWGRTAWGVRSNTSDIFSKSWWARRIQTNCPSLRSGLLSFALVCSHLLSLALRYSHLQKDRGPSLRYHLLSFALVCSHLLSFAFIYSRLGLGTICMKRSFKYNRNLFRQIVPKGTTKRGPSLRFHLLSFGVVFSLLLSFTIICCRLGVGNLHEAFAQIRTQKKNEKRTRDKCGPSRRSHWFSFALVCSHLLSFTIICTRFGIGDVLHEASVQIRPKSSQKDNAQGEQRKRGPSLRFHILSLAFVCCHVLSFPFICCRLGLVTICMRRSYKYERYLLQKMMRKEKQTNMRQLPSLSFTLVCSRLLPLDQIYYNLLSFGVGDDLHEAFVQIRATSTQKVNAQGKQKLTRPLPSLSFTLVCFCLLPIAFIYCHLLSFGVGDDLHEASVQIRTIFYQ